RYGVASLVVVNNMDRIAEDALAEFLARVEGRVRDLNPEAYVVGAVAGRVDPRLLYDINDGDQAGQMSFRELLLDGAAPSHDDHHDHVHAASVTVVGDGAVDPGPLLDLLEQPPRGVYRMKGTVAIGKRHYLFNVVGRSVHVTTAAAAAGPSHLVAIGTDLDIADVQARLEVALRPAGEKVAAAGMRRLQRLRHYSI
ncbi:GTP-binding protein, partial [Mycolicibacter arupensis]|uniref:GTP-binding protein n=1 Tax=Mycolicibacter arupensis TaxID=342002 RepID=UPI003B3A2FA9